MISAEILALHARFQAAGYHWYYLPDIHGIDDNAVGLKQTPEGWKVADWERGRPSFESLHTELKTALIELEARVSATAHWHCVGFSGDVKAIQQLEEKLKTLGIPFHRNDIPSYRDKGDYTYRVFVVNAAIHDVVAAFGSRNPLDERTPS